MAPSYGTMKPVELRSRLRQRGLPEYGRKKDMVERLMGSDLDPRAARRKARENNRATTAAAPTQRSRRSGTLPKQLTARDSSPAQLPNIASPNMPSTSPSTDVRETQLGRFTAAAPGNSSETLPDNALAGTDSNPIVLGADDEEGDSEVEYVSTPSRSNEARNVSDKHSASPAAERLAPESHSSPWHSHHGGTSPSDAGQDVEPPKSAADLAQNQLVADHEAQGEDSEEVSSNSDTESLSGEPQGSQAASPPPNAAPDVAPAQHRAVVQVQTGNLDGGNAPHQGTKSTWPNSGVQGAKSLQPKFGGHFPSPEAAHDWYEVNVAQLSQWMPPSPPDMVDHVEQQTLPLVKFFYYAFTNTGDFFDNQTNFGRKNWVLRAKYTSEMIESACFELVKEVIELHRYGFKGGAKYDLTADRLKKLANQDRNLDIEDRIMVIYVALYHWKIICDEMVTLPPGDRDRKRFVSAPALYFRRKGENQHNNNIKAQKHTVTRRNAGEEEPEIPLERLQNPDLSKGRRDAQSLGFTLFKDNSEVTELIQSVNRAPRTTLKATQSSPSTNALSMPQHALKRRKLNSANRLPVTVPATPRLNRGHPLQQVSLASPEATGPIAQGEGEGSNRLAPSQRAGRPSPFAPAGFNDEVENYVNDDGEAGDEDDDGSTNTLPRPSYLFDPYENDSVGLSSTLPRATAHQANHPNRLLRPSLPNMAHRSPGPQFYRNSNALFNTRASGAPTSRPNYAMGFSRAAALQDLSRMSQAEILLYLELAERERMGFGRQ